MQGHGTHGSSATAASSSSSDEPCSPLVMLPWLALVGRCCLYWADHFWRLFVLKDAPAPAGGSTQAAVLEATSASKRLTLLGCDSSRDAFFKAEPMNLGLPTFRPIHHILAPCHCYMNENRATLTAAGYDAVTWLQQMEGLVRAVVAAQPAGKSSEPGADAARS